MSHRRQRGRIGKSSVMTTVAILFWTTPAVGQVETCTDTMDIVDRLHKAEIVLTFDRTYTGNYRPGEPYDYITINPAGTGETLEDTGITLRIRALCVPIGAPLDQGQPIVGLPADEIVLFSTSLCMCESKHPDHETDAEGWTEFTGTIAGGGCSQGLYLFVEGVYVDTIPVNINSTDAGTTSPCHTDAGDLAVLAEKLGVPEEWDICFDYNESGPPTIDTGDLAFFAQHVGAACPATR